MDERQTQQLSRSTLISNKTAEKMKILRDFLAKTGFL